MNSVDPQALVDQISNEILTRLSATNPSPEDYQENGTILAQFIRIAMGMLQDEPGIEMPGSVTPTPWNEPMVSQALRLFGEGLYYAVIRCAEASVVGELKRNLLQNLAMEVYGQAKQIVIATMGQEQTPEFQFSAEQQTEIIQKATEGYLMAYITEYERANGPIQPQPASPSAVLQSPLPADTQPLPIAGEPSAAPIAPRPTEEDRPSHEKYGAVALLAATLPAEQRERILSPFNAQERELIAYYSDPQHMKAHLDMARVEILLKQFHEMLTRGTSAEKPRLHEGIRRLLETYSLEKLLSYVKDERPRVMRHLKTLHEQISSSTASLRREAMAGEPALNPLAPRVEEVLYRYLARRLEGY